MAGRKQLLQRLYRRVSPEQHAALRCAVAQAERRGADVYLVGGAVRDLLLGADQFDLDLVVEGDAIALARGVGRELKARTVAHTRFGTASVRGDGFQLDFARARSERYERPGALPAVRPASLLDDLTRRDFPIHAMALRLAGRDAGALIDPHGGRADLNMQRIRLLHDGSFRDDATRMLRAARYAGRLRFRIEPRTVRLIRRDLRYLDTISGARVRRELERIAQEDRAGAIVRLADRLGVLQAIHAALRPDPRALRAIDRLARVSDPRRSAVLFALLLSGATPSRAQGAIERLSLNGEQSSAVRGLLALRRAASRLTRATLRPSAATRIFDQQPVAAVEAFVLLTGGTLAGRRAASYLRKWKGVRPLLDGHDVVALGVPAGPRVGTALSALRDARLDELVKSRADEESLVRKRFVRRAARSSRG